MSIMYRYNECINKMSRQLYTFYNIIQRYNEEMIVKIYTLSNYKKKKTIVNQYTYLYITDNRCAY